MILIGLHMYNRNDTVCLDTKATEPELMTLDGSEVDFVDLWLESQFSALHAVWFREIHFSFLLI